MKKYAGIFFMVLFSLSCALVSVQDVDDENEELIGGIPVSSGDSKWRLNGWKLYNQALGGVDGTCVVGANSLDGQGNDTDLIFAGTTGLGSWRSIQGYYSNTSLSLAHIRSEEDDRVADMIAYYDTDDDNTDIIFIQQPHIVDLIFQ